jgi:hypothetical protein
VRNEQLPLDHYGRGDLLGGKYGLTFHITYILYYGLAKLPTHPLKQRWGGEKGNIPMDSDKRGSLLGWNDVLLFHNIYILYYSPVKRPPLRLK